MHIVVVGLNHTTASVELRERVSIQECDIPHVLTQLRETRTVLESVVLSTCNRTEIYAVVGTLRAGEDFLKTYLARRANCEVADIELHFYMYRGEMAIRHLMKVAAGLDSLVIGETQILGQVRHAFHLALEDGSSGALLNQLFRLAIQVGKRAQTETGIGQNPVSVSYAAVQLAKKIFGDLRERKALVIGAGKMSELAAQHLTANGISVLYITNRTYEKAVILANRFEGQALAWDTMENVLGQVDIVISSTGANGTILNRQTVASAMQKRGARPTAFIDIAMPRDIEASVGTLKQVYLYDLDDLQGVVAANLAERERQAVLVNEMIQEGIQDFSNWLAEQEVVPLISAIRAKGMSIQASVMKSLEQKLPSLSERERKLIHKHTMSIVNQLLRDPIQNMKELAITSHGSEHVEVFAQLFGVTDEEIRSFMDSTWSSESAESLHGRNEGFAKLIRSWRESILSEGGESSHQGAGLYPALR